MNKFVYSLIFFVLPFTLSGQSTEDHTSGSDLLPVPQNMQFSGGEFHWNEKVKVTFSPEAKSSIEIFKDLTGLNFSEEKAEEASSLFIFISTKNSKVPALPKEIKGKGQEAYTLMVDKKSIRITANSPQGLLWGLMTLAQLVEHNSSGNPSVKGVRIVDMPEYAWRGYMLDTGRAPYSADQIKRVMRICAAFKLNFLIIREGDDELNAFRFKNLPIGSDNPYALTLDEVADLIAYGKKYGLTVFPEIESLGHIEAKRKFYPELVEGGIQQDYWPGFHHIRKANFNIDHPGTYKLLYAMYNEIFPILDAHMVHLGLDEVRLTKEQQAEHLKRLLPIVKEMGKKYNKDLDILVWSDAPPTPERYKDKVIRCLWRYGHKITENTSKLNRQGLKELLKPDCKQRVFMAGGSGTNHKPYSKDSYVGAITNLYSWAKLGEGHPNFTGIYAVQWASNTIDGWIPDFLMAADFGWNVPAKEPDTNMYLKKLSTRLKAVPDFVSPRPEEVPRPAWDGIWLNGNNWGEDIITGEKAAPVVTIDPAGGYISDSGQKITINSSLPEAKIYYTTDGTIPDDKTGTLYFEPFSITSTTSIKAVAYVTGRAPSYLKEALFVDSALQTPPVIKADLKPGLEYQYFENDVTKARKLQNFEPVKKDIIKTISFPDFVNDVEKFGLIFVSYLHVPSDGRYTFYIRSNDGSRLLLNNKEVINNDGRHAAEEKSVVLNLKKGYYPLEVKYFQYGGGKELKLYWEGPGFSKQEITETNYFH